MELTAEQNDCIYEILSGNNVFISGNAGVGKSFLINHLSSILKKTAILTFTGCASLKIKGASTIHSFFQLSPKFENFEQYMENNGDRRDFRYLKWNTFIFDEISMISSDLLEMLDQMCRFHRKIDKPFGGIQIILCGDFLQLSPIKSQRYFFETELWNSLDLKITPLRKVLRQTDESFITSLNKLRKGTIDEETNLFLEEIQNNKREKGVPYTILVATNSERTEINERKLAKLEGKEMIYQSKDSGKTEKLKPLIVENILKLKEGATCMLLQNRKIDGLVNGSIGRIVDLFSTFAVVDFNGKLVEIGKSTFEVFAEGKVIAQRLQIPLCICYSITVTKSQGSSIDNLIVDASRIFAKSQLYVALSRATKKERLLLRGLDMTRNPFDVDDRVLAFYDSIEK